MENQIMFKISKEDLDLIKKAAVKIGLGHTTFCRMASLKEAKIINS